MDEWGTLLLRKEKLEEEYPKVSIIIPTCNSSQAIDVTLDSLLKQRYPSFEILVIDAASKDQTLEVVKSYRSSLVRLYSVASYNRYEMLNKGISLARGAYLNILFPGDFYISEETLHVAMNFALKEKLPDLVYCGCLLRDGKSEARLMYRPVTLELLEKGQQPTNLQSCWFKSSFFRSSGKFNTDLKLRGGFDLMCRLLLNPKVKIASFNRILTDYDLNLITRKMVMQHFFETFRTLKKYFGIWTAALWLFNQKDTSRYVKLLYRSFRTAVVGR